MRLALRIQMRFTISEIRLGSCQIQRLQKMFLIKLGSARAKTALALFLRLRHILVEQIQRFGLG